MQLSRRRRTAGLLRGDGRHRHRRGDHGGHRPQPEASGGLGGVLPRPRRRTPTILPCRPPSRWTTAPPLKRKAHVIVIGNVGFLQANIQLIPDARADDGLLDVLVASPRRDSRLGPDHHPGADPAAAYGRSGRPADRPQGDRSAWRAGTSSRSTATRSGECSTMTAEVRPGVLTLRVPRTRLAGAYEMDPPAPMPALTQRRLRPDNPTAAVPEADRAATRRVAETRYLGLSGTRRAAARERVSP